MPSRPAPRASRLRALAFYFLLFAFLLLPLVVAVAGRSPLEAGAALVQGAAGSPSRLAESLSKTIPLVMAGLSVALAFRAGFFNIGAEGQMLMGALAAAALGAKAHLPVGFVLFGGALAGALWALLAGVLKVRRGAPEIITTIMLNYIALQLVAFAVQGPLQEAARAQPQSDVLPPQSQLPALLPDTNLHAGLFIALACAALCWWLLFRTERGFLWRAAGANPLAARGAGIDAGRQTLGAVALCGALAGLGGAMEVAGTTRQLGMGGFGYGYTAIAVALLGALNPLGVLPAALLFGMLDAGGKAMERTAGVPSVAVSVVIGILIFALAVAPRLRRAD